jgi:uncharacterized protein
MNKLPSRLRRLDDALADISVEQEAMMLSELDGFLTGILVCPEPITVGEWLPMVWGGGERAPYDDPADVRWFADMVVARYNEIARDVGRQKPQPLFDVDERNGEALWDLWVEGFGTAMALRPDSWSLIADGDDAEAADALAGMTTLVEIVSEDTALTSVEINEICDDAATRISGLTVRLHRWRMMSVAAAADPPKPAKIGRNDPCMCGSGRKSKRCCGSA